MQTAANEELARHDDYRAEASEIKKVTHQNLPTKLDVGCSFRKPTGYWGTDKYPFTGVDQVFDHATFPWPLPDNHFTEIRLWHILQYLPDARMVMEEVWRIAEPGAKVLIGVPYYSSITAFGDRNKSFFNEHSFNDFTDRSWYREERAVFAPKAYFELTKLEFHTTGRLRRLLPFKNILRHFLWNIIDEMEVHLTVKK